MYRMAIQMTASPISPPTMATPGMSDHARSAASSIRPLSHASAARTPAAARPHGILEATPFHGQGPVKLGRGRREWTGGSDPWIEDRPHETKDSAMPKLRVHNFSISLD